MEYIFLASLEDYQRITSLINLYSNQLKLGINVRKNRKKINDLKKTRSLIFNDLVLIPEEVL